MSRWPSRPLELDAPRSLGAWLRRSRFVFDAAGFDFFARHFSALFGLGSSAPGAASIRRSVRRGPLRRLRFARRGFGAPCRFQPLRRRLRPLRLHRAAPPLQSRRAGHERRCPIAPTAADRDRRRAVATTSDRERDAERRDQARRGSSAPRHQSASRAKGIAVASATRRGKPAAARSSSSAANSGRGVGPQRPQLGEEGVVVKSIHRGPPSTWSRRGGGGCRRWTR